MNRLFACSMRYRIPRFQVPAMTALQDKSFDLRLELKLEISNEVSLQVENDKFVEYKVPGNSNVTGVSIFYEDKLLHHIDKVLITN
jgi:hypothetical protein